MTTMAAVGLSDAVQTLIDARLDTIDRMLLGRVPRSDRLAIVREVEGQIHDLLAERGSDEPDRDDVLAVLARLDPPEAYLPEESDGAAPAVRVPSAPRAVAPPCRRSRAPAASWASALGLFLLVPVFFGFGDGGRVDGPGLRRLRGRRTELRRRHGRDHAGRSTSGSAARWAVAGLVTGIASTLLSLIGAIGLLFLL